MTGWHLRGGYSSRFVDVDVDRALCDVVADVRADTKALHAEAFDGTTLHGYLEHYATCQDATISQIEREGRVEFMLLASGGGPDRDLKEQARRVFCRVVMKRMHFLGMDVTLVVA